MQSFAEAWLEWLSFLMTNKTLHKHQGGEINDEGDHRRRKARITRSMVKVFQKEKAHKKAAEDQSSIMSRLSFESIENSIVTLKVKGKSLKMGVLAVSGMDIFDLNDYDRNTVFNNFAKGNY